MHYYNEIDPYAADWIRNLIAADLIPNGHVDTRDIRDVLPSDLAGYTSCHFFAGLGGWAYALRLAGWPDDRPVWTGSCPCQPFSAAGKGGGFADERHLWPAWFWLIVQCRPDVIFGEQVDKATDWLDLVATDLEGEDYACGPIILPAAGGGAPHGRHRLWFVADTAGERRTRESVLLLGEESRRVEEDRVEAAGSGAVDKLADTQCGAAERWRHNVGDSSSQIESKARKRERLRVESRSSSAVGELAQSSGAECGVGRAECGGTDRWRAHIESARSSHPRQLGDPDDPRFQGWRLSAERVRELLAGAPSVASGFWGDADWIYCRDGRYRPVEPGTFPLAHGVSDRVGRLRAYGNAIVPQIAAEVIRAYMEMAGTPSAIPTSS